MISLALYQPEIPQNVGTLLRLASCLDMPVSIIEPCGFIWDDKRLLRAGMDYIDLADVTKFASFTHFKELPGRKVLIDTKGTTDYYDFDFKDGDHLLLGQESVGVPDDVFKECDETVRIHMKKGCRSLNVAVAGAMVVSEANRQVFHVK